VSVLREVVAHAELMHTPLCILSLDFRSAFDCISDRYLFQILAGYGISAWFIDRIRSMYENATASLQINGPLADPIPIQSAIRQGCPLSMALYALRLHPLLRTLEDRRDACRPQIPRCQFETPMDQPPHSMDLGRQAVDVVYGDP